MLAVWAPELPFQLARLREPELHGRPLGFRSPAGGRTPRLWMVDRLAKAAGLEMGLPVDVALHRDPGMVVLEPVPTSWLDARAFLGKQLLTYSPVGKLGRLGEGFLDLRGTERLHGPILDTAERVRREFRDLAGWETHGGLSRSLCASRLAARAEDQVRLIEGGLEIPFLAPYPLGAIPSLEARSRDRLWHFGLQRIAQVQPMDVAALGRVIPPAEAFQVLRQARGEDQEALPALEVAQQSESLRWVLNPPLEKYEIGLASWFWQEAWAWRLDGRFLRRVEISWWDEDEMHHVFTQRFEGQDLWSFSRDLEAQFRQEAVRRKVIQRIEAEAWLSSTEGQQPLFQDASTTKRRAVEAVTLKLHKRFGSGALHFGIGP